MSLYEANLLTLSGHCPAQHTFVWATDPKGFDTELLRKEGFALFLEWEYDGLYILYIWG